MEGESYYRPRGIAVNLGRWKRVKNSLLNISSALVLAGVTACFFVPQSRVSSLRVTARLFGMSGGHGDGLVITKERIIRAMGLKSNDLNMFASVQKAESGLASAWFVSHAYPVEVALTPFSCQVTFHDLFPLSKGMDGAIYLSDGTSYAAASPEVKAAYPEAALDWLVRWGRTITERRSGTCRSSWPIWILRFWPVGFSSGLRWIQSRRVGYISI